MAPNDGYMVAVLTDVAVGVNDIEKASSWTDFGIRSDPANKGHYSFLKGWALTSGERYQESAKVMEELGDWFANIPLFKAINAVNLGNLEEAKLNVKKALELDPSWTAKKFREVNFVNDEVLDRQVSDLIKAGLPVE